MTNDRLDEIKQRLDAATPGPWTWKYDQLISPTGNVATTDHSVDFICIKEDDAALIAAAPDDVRYMLGVIAELQAKSDACAWEKDNAKLQLEDTGISWEEFPFGCDTLQHVATALVGQRNHSKKLETQIAELQAIIANNLKAHDAALLNHAAMRREWQASDALKDKALEILVADRTGCSVREALDKAKEAQT